MKKNIAAMGAAISLMMSPGTYALQTLADQELAVVVGQNLFVADQYVGLTGTPGEGLMYTRMGLNVDMELNANINKFQLGCGGFNESIRTGCDVDMDYVSLMGLNAAKSGGGAIGSDFKLTRPYIEIVTTNTGNATQREVVGIKIGAQQANGYFGVGRVYKDGETNLENGGTCGSSAGAAALACHSGLNTISGFLGVEMSAQVPVTVAGIFNETACFGNTSFTNDACGSGDAFYRDIVGSRIDAFRAPSIPLKLSGGFLSAIGISKAYANVTESLRFVHGFALDQTSDFGLSFQRQQVSYLKYDKSGYSSAANAGWWMNVPNVKVVDLKGDHVSISLGQVGAALGEPGLPLSNIELNQTPPSNCFGSSKFC